MRKLLILLPFIMFSCSKDEMRVDTQTQFLLQGEWVNTHTIFHWVSLEDSASVRSDSFAQPDCKLDDKLIFKSDKTMKNYQGPIKCLPNESQGSEILKWDMVNDNTQMIYIFPNGRDTLDLKLTESAIVLSKTQRTVHFGEQMIVTAESYFKNVK